METKFQGKGRNTLVEYACISDLTTNLREIHDYTVYQKDMFSEFE